MTLSGHDPAGGAGIHADIEAISATGCHAASVITCLTIQDTHNVYTIKPLEAEWILQQARTILKDMPVCAFKIGLTGNCDVVDALSELVQEYSGIPVILDPVLAAGGGKHLAKDKLIQAICEKLIPYTTLITPNVPEAQQLTGQNSPQHCAKSLADMGCGYTLITGTHAQTPNVVNQLYQNQTLISDLSWPRLPYTYHGSGCTLASSISGFIAQGNNIPSAVTLAQKYTWNSLNNARHPGQGQWIPKRI